MEENTPIVAPATDAVAAEEIKNPEEQPLEVAPETPAETPVETETLAV